MKKEEGGRHTAFRSKYRPQFYIRTLDVTGEITLPEGVEMVMPGDNVEITVKLIVDKKKMPSRARITAAVYRWVICWTSRRKSW